MRPRERLLALAAGLALAAWALDALVLEPGLDRLAALRTERDAARSRAAEAGALVDRAGRIAGEWRGRHAAGLMADEDGARARLQECLAAAARSSGCQVESASGGQRVAAGNGEAFDLIRLSATCQGSLPQVLALLDALAAAAIPLAVERCELAARDARKDEVDLALTLSTRFAAAGRRAGRPAEATGAAWTPTARPATAAAAVLAARPFLADRRAARSTVAAAPAPAPGGWALVGVLGRADGRSSALWRHLGDGREQELVVGQALGGATIAAIRADAVDLDGEGGARTLAVGNDLDGAAIPAARRAPAGRAAAPAAAPASTAAAAAAPAGDSDRSSILQRLRQQRNHATGAAP
jgi:hypothetical protein